jgi:hypothetical protein
MTIERCSPVHPGSSLASVTEDDSLGPESLTTLVFSMSPVGSQACSWQDYRKAGSASAKRLFRVVSRRSPREPDRRGPAFKALIQGSLQR